jgi:hypothetical protein
MHLFYIPVVLLLLTSCQGTQSRDPSSSTFRIPEGSTLTLNRALDIPAGHTHALLQSGKPMTNKKSNLYEISCRFDTRSFGPKTLEPEVFRIRRTEDGQREASKGGIWAYYSEVYLDSDKGTDVVMLRCQTWGYNTQWHFSVSDMKAALGDYFTFTFPKSSNAG